MAAELPSAEQIFPETTPFGAPDFLSQVFRRIEIRSWTSIIKVTDDPGNENENKTENPFAYE